jgi:hypothetical protein
MMTLTALALALALASSAGAQGLDPQATEALAATLKMLIDPNQRSAAIAGSSQATAIDQQVRSLTGSEALTQEFFALAADVVQELTVATAPAPTPPPSPPPSALPPSSASARCRSRSPTRSAEGGEADQITAIASSSIM